MWKYLAALCFLAACADTTAVADPVVSARAGGVTSQERNILMNLLRTGLKDPDSVKVLGIKSSSLSYASGRKERILGIGYNAKNSYGGYVGYKTVWFDGQGQRTLFGNLADGYCRYSNIHPTPLCDTSFGTHLPQ